MKPFRKTAKFRPQSSWNPEAGPYYHTDICYLGAKVWHCIDKRIEQDASVDEIFGKETILRKSENAGDVLSRSFFIQRGNCIG